MRLDGGSVRVRFEQGDTRTQPNGGDAIGMKEGDATAPVAATTVFPRAPPAPSEVPDVRSPCREAMSEGFLNSGHGIRCGDHTPHLAIGLLQLYP